MVTGTCSTRALHSSPSADAISINPLRISLWCTAISVSTLSCNFFNAFSSDGLSLTSSFNSFNPFFKWIFHSPLDRFPELASVFKWMVSTPVSSCFDLISSIILANDIISSAPFLNYIILIHYPYTFHIKQKITRQNFDGWALYKLPVWVSFLSCRPWRK